MLCLLQSRFVESQFLRINLAQATHTTAGYNYTILIIILRYVLFLLYMSHVTNILLIIRGICSILWSMQNEFLEIIEKKLKYFQTKQTFD